MTPRRSAAGFVLVVAVATATAGLGAALQPDRVAGQVTLAVDASVAAPPFDRASALLPATVAPFEARLSPGARAAFSAGVSNLKAGSFLVAELAFKRAIASDADGTAPLAYLAVTYAASGHDAEAASAWQLALANGSDLQQIYRWLGRALVRSRDVAEARAVYEEAIARWPDEARFVVPLAVIDASLGRSSQALARLEGYLSGGHDDPVALYLAIDWLHQLHAARTSVHGVAEDVALARTWADRYAKAGGPSLAVVRQWVGELSRER